MASRFCILSTVVSEGTDGSPRGDDVRLSLMFIVARKTNVVRVNSRAIVTAVPKYVVQFEQKGHHPRSVGVITVAEAYSQMRGRGQSCALMPLRQPYCIWFASMGDILRANGR